MEILTGCEVADAAVSSFPVVKHFNVFLDSESCAGSAGESLRVIHFVFRVAKNDSATELSQQAPVFPTLRVTSIVVQYVEKPDDGYWLPLSE